MTCQGSTLNVKVQLYLLLASVGSMSMSRSDSAQRKSSWMHFVVLTVTENKKCVAETKL